MTVRQYFRRLFLDWECRLLMIFCTLFGGLFLWLRFAIPATPIIDLLAASFFFLIGLCYPFIKEGAEKRSRHD